MTDGRLSSRYAGGSSLVDLLDRVIDRGAVVSGDIVIALEGIDLIRLDLRLLIVGVASRLEHHARCS